MAERQKSWDLHEAVVLLDGFLDKAYSYLDEPLKDVLRRWKQFVK